MDNKKYIDNKIDELFKSIVKDKKLSSGDETIEQHFKTEQFKNMLVEFIEINSNPVDEIVGVLDGLEKQYYNIMDNINHIIDNKDRPFKNVLDNNYNNIHEICNQSISDLNNLRDKMDNHDRFKDWNFIEYHNNIDRLIRRYEVVDSLVKNTTK